MILLNHKTKKYKYNKKNKKKIKIFKFLNCGIFREQEKK